MKKIDDHDSRRALLEARRYHVTVDMGYGDGCMRSGKFFYDSLHAARTFLRAQYRDSLETVGFEDDLTPAVWRDVWSRGGLSFDIGQQEDTIKYSFAMRLIDTHAEGADPRSPTRVFADVPADWQPNFWFVDEPVIS